MAWKDGKRWVYSITYDEGCAGLLDHALAVHREYEIPGHVCLLASQIGVARDVPGSSYDGMMILSKAQIHDLYKEGWGASCHSMTHAAIVDANAQVEVVESRHVLAEALDLPISLFCVPGSNEGYSASLAVAGDAGYDGIMTIYDDINRWDVDLMRLCRCPVHTEYPPPFYSRFDPYKRIHQAIDAGGWIIDYAHCPMPGKAIHPWKDCTIDELAQRFEAVRRVGGDDVWLSEPNEVVEYVLSERGS